MGKLTDEAKHIISEYGPAFIATANRDGQPNVSAKGSFRVLDDEHVVFAEIASPRTFNNLKENSQVSAIVFDATTRTGCRIWGTGEILSSGKLFDEVSEEYAKRNMKVRHVIKIAVDEVLTF